jgi:hypothetical protein
VLLCFILLPDFRENPIKLKENYFDFFSYFILCWLVMVAKKEFFFKGLSVGIFQTREESHIGVLVNKEKILQTCCFSVSGMLKNKRPHICVQFHSEENEVREMKNMPGASHVFSTENQIKEEAGGAQGGFYGGKLYGIQLTVWALKDGKLKCSLAFYIWK